MLEILHKGRKVLRVIYRILGVSAIALVFQSCYGMPVGEIPPYEEVPATEDGASEDEEKTTE